MCIQAGGQGCFYQSEAGRDLGVKEKMREKERPRSSDPHGRGQERHLGPSSAALRTLPWKGSGAGRSGHHSSAIVISPLTPAGPGAPLPGRQGGLTPWSPGLRGGAEPADTGALPASGLTWALLPEHRAQPPSRPGPSAPQALRHCHQVTTSLPRGKQVLPPAHLPLSVLLEVSFWKLFQNQ